MSETHSGEKGTPTTEELLAQYADPSRPPACADCGRRPVPSRLVPGQWIDSHGGACPQNSALQVCERCGRRHADLDFGQALACIMDVPLPEGREMQRRICDRIAGDHSDSSAASGADR